MPYTYDKLIDLLARWMEANPDKEWDDLIEQLTGYEMSDQVNKLLKEQDDLIEQLTGYEMSQAAIETNREHRFLMFDDMERASEQVTELANTGWLVMQIQSMPDGRMVVHLYREAGWHTVSSETERVHNVVTDTDSEAR